VAGAGTITVVDDAGGCRLTSMRTWSAHAHPNGSESAASPATTVNNVLRLIIVHFLVFSRARRSPPTDPGILGLRRHCRASSKFSIDRAIPHTTRTKVSVLLDSPVAMAIPGRNGAIATGDQREKELLGRRKTTA
jgi:hypothetical protein